MNGALNKGPVEVVSCKSRKGHPRSSNGHAGGATISERVGAAIRQARLQRRLTLAEVASAARISVPMLSRFETGRSAVGLEVLERICAAFGVELPSLLSDSSGSRFDAQIVNVTDGLNSNKFGDRSGYSCRLLVPCEEPPKGFTPFLVDIGRPCRSYPNRRHGNLEFIYMLKGRMEYRVGDRTFNLKPGDAFTFSGDLLHGPERLIADHVQFLAIVMHTN
ncbi:helix-turn-helix domain-containing protein [Bradyrhizobium sp. CCBAU 45394]|uniref:helix-turn-helix domain-containing protein n=1 Tax=Bradyrhizobium sp. CCBAU 45394 TaxID=1325087 RepID=UPI003FA41B0C